MMSNMGDGLTLQIGLERHSGLLLTHKGSQPQYALVANVHCVERIKI
jgi:hypothetical protein